MNNDRENLDPFLEEMILEAMGPEAALLPAPLRAVLREALIDQVLEDPDLQSLYRAARPRAAPEQSHEQVAQDGAFANEGASKEAAPPLERKEGAA